MYKNIGKKIKRLAVFSFVIGALASIIIGISLIVVSGDSFTVDEEILVIAGIAVIVFGVLISWISSFVLYGYGELIQKTVSIEGAVNNAEPNIDNAQQLDIKSKVTLAYDSSKPVDVQCNAEKPQPTANPHYQAYSETKVNDEVKTNVADHSKTTMEQPINNSQISVQLPVIESHPVSFFCSRCGNRLTIERAALKSSPATICPRCNSTINNEWIINHFAKQFDKEVVEQ